MKVLNILLLVIVLYCLCIDAKRIKSPRTSKKLQHIIADDEESCPIPLIEEPAPVEIPIRTIENVAVEKVEEEEKSLRIDSRSQGGEEVKKLANRTKKNKKSKRSSKRHQKRARKVPWHQVLRTFVISLFDPTCEGQIDLTDLVGAEGIASGSSKTAVPSRHEVTPGIVPMATYGPVCGPNGCF